MMKIATRIGILAAALSFLLPHSSFGQSWTTSRLLNDPSETAVKSARIYAAKNGGFHAVYSNTSPAWQTVYRRYKDGYLSPRIVARTGFAPNAEICEAGNGDIHLVWEDWDGNLEIGWAVSKDGGLSFAPFQEISNTGDTKFPLIAPYGPDNGPDVMMSYWNANKDSKHLYWRSYNGTSWGALTNMWQNADNEYCVVGICRSLQDGTVYRAYGTQVGGVISYAYRRFNGTFWEPQVVAASPGFFARQSIAVNPIGQVMCIWEQDDRVWWRLFTPGSGWSSIGQMENLTGYSQVTAIPGSNDFYLAYTYNMNSIYGRRFSGGAWSARELVSVGVPVDFTVGADVAAGPDGTLYACWEYWGSGNCQQYYSIKPAAPCPGGSGNLSGFVRDQHGNGISGATVGSGAYATVSGTGGYYTLQMCAGTYSVSANKEFYTGQTISGIQVYANQTTYQDFYITANPPAPVVSFTAIPSDATVRLYWTNPSSGNYRGTMIRVKTTGYPTGPTDGVLVCDRAAMPSSSDSFVHSGLPNGVHHYYSAFAHDGALHYSAPVSLLAVPLDTTCMYAKQLSEGSTIDLKGKVVTAVFSADSCLYIEEADRSSGMRVAWSGTGLAVGDRVDVSGTVTSRKPDGVNVAERQITATSVTKLSSGTPLKPIAMLTSSVGGAEVPPYVPGVLGGIGTNNMGLLVEIAGKVTYKVTSYIYVDEGCGMPDISGRVGVMVRCPSTSIPAVVGDMVAVRGVIEGSIPSGWETNRRLIRMRDWNDLTVYPK